MSNADDRYRRRLEQLSSDDNPRNDTPAQRGARMDQAKARRRSEFPDGMRRAVIVR